LGHIETDRDEVFGVVWTALPLVEYLIGLEASVPDDQPPALSEQWLAEISRRSAEIDSGAVTPKS